ncbi:hypothetical protein [Cerasicoccus maritimus]|uniref:hypothetical protein n=1 Tax=Cerasicoccus maritimus TaxID=490089 RepID=UPI002852BCFD|nr:hypothetical protein [Cerasicoccus maritimus]
MKRWLIPAASFFLIISLVGCETWPVAAARAAKKRESQTGPVVGELEEDTGISDPLDRKQNDIDSTADSIDKKVDTIADDL